MFWIYIQVKTNQRGWAYFSYLLTEKELPTGFPQIIQNPGMKVVEKGRNAVLVCEATGEPAPVITWIKDVVPINLEVGLSFAWKCQL